MNTPDICPDRSNWRQFCQELPLTTAEITVWRKMADTIQNSNTDELKNFVAAATVAEEAAWRKAAGTMTDDWADLVNEIDANRRLERAELAAWARWQEQEINNVS